MISTLDDSLIQTQYTERTIQTDQETATSIDTQETTFTGWAIGDFSSQLTVDIDARSIGQKKRKRPGKQKRGHPYVPRTKVLESIFFIYIVASL